MWPSEGFLNYNTILQLDLFCKREEKWTEFPYIQLFFYIQDHPKWLYNCYLHIQILAILFKSQDKYGEEGPEKPLTKTRPLSLLLPLLLHILPCLLSHPNIQNLLLMFPPSTESSRKRASLCPFQLSDLRDFKKDLGSCTDALGQYIQAFISVIQTFKLAWKDIMLLLDQTLSSLEKQGVLAWATQVGGDFYTQ
jgi:hypothetical protein